jgi:hypothetical protein
MNVHRERHDLLPIAAVRAVTLVAKGDARFVERDQATARDGNPVRKASTGLSAPQKAAPALPEDWQMYRPNACRSARCTIEPAGGMPDASISSVPSSIAMPSLGKMIWTFGWWIMVDPYVCRTALMPVRAPRCFRSAAIVSIVSDAALVSTAEMAAQSGRTKYQVQIGETIHWIW